MTSCGLLASWIFLMAAASFGDTVFFFGTTTVDGCLDLSCADASAATPASAIVRVISRLFILNSFGSLRICKCLVEPLLCSLTHLLRRAFDCQRGFIEILRLLPATLHII